MKLKDIAEYVTDKISSNAIDLDCYVTTDSLLHNKAGREVAVNLPPQVCTLTHFRQGDILIGNIRPYLKKIWMADIDGGCNADVLVIRAKDGHSPSFIYALLLQDAFYEYAMKGAKGSKMPRGDKDQIMRYEIPTLSSTEESIGKFIVDIRDKINVLTQINRNLEAMARQLYDYWFVQFDFPDENGKPYKSSRGKMVWNNTLKREIPEGWCVENLEYYIEYITDRISASNKGKSFYTPIEVIPRKKFSFSDYAPIEEATSGLCRYKEHDILLSNRRVYFHKVCVAPSDGITRDTVIILRPQEELLGYAFQLVFSDHFISYATQHSYGSEQPVLSWESAKKYKVIKPLHCIDVRYSRIVNPMIGQILANEREIRDIKKFRDELLPLLMNGQVSVMPSEVNCDLSLD